jgi:hypothetical protein
VSERAAWSGRSVDDRLGTGPFSPQYLDPLIVATWSEDGAVHDVFKALAPKVKEPNAVVSLDPWRLCPATSLDADASSLRQVVFKALLTFHTLIRNGSTNNILAYLSNGNVLKLNSVSTPNWEGAPSVTPPIPDVKMKKLTICAQDIRHQRICPTTLHISTPEFEPSATSSTM